MDKKRAFKIVAIVSTLGMIAWFATAFFGGMYIYFLTYSVIIIPIVLLYNVSFVETFISIYKRGLRDNRLKVILHSVVILTIWVLFFIRSDVFKSKRVITATLKVDPYTYTVIFRANGICESEAFSMFGYKEFKRGKYKLYGDTIVFQKKPSDIRFVPDTLLIDRNAKAIYLNKNQVGKFDEDVNWSEHFDIK